MTLQEQAEALRQTVSELETAGAPHVDVVFESVPGRPRLTLLNECVALGQRIAALTNAD